LRVGQRGFPISADIGPPSLLCKLCRKDRRHPEVESLVDQIGRAGDSHVADVEGRLCIAVLSDPVLDRDAARHLIDVGRALILLVQSEDTRDGDQFVTDIGAAITNIVEIHGHCAFQIPRHTGGSERADRAGSAQVKVEGARSSYLV